jgi:hypothetical protein
MFQFFNVERSDFNVICAPVTDLLAKKSDHNNGYFVVEGLWGSCFFRIATQKQHFEIVGNNNPRCPHTYTKIPLFRAGNTYFVYVNYKKGYKIALPKGAIVVGLHQAQPHKLGGWWSQTCLVYCPSGESPVVEEFTQANDPDFVCFDQSGNEILLSVENLTGNFPVKYIHLNEDGYLLRKDKATETILYTPATTSIGDFLTTIE